MDGAAVDGLTLMPRFINWFMKTLDLEFSVKVIRLKAASPFAFPGSSLAIQRRPPNVTKLPNISSCYLFIADSKSNGARLKWQLF